jgi:hypothetical protein
MHKHPHLQLLNSNALRHDWCTFGWGVPLMRRRQIAHMSWHFGILRPELDPGLSLSGDRDGARSPSQRDAA